MKRFILIELLIKELLTKFLQDLGHSSKSFYMRMVRQGHDIMFYIVTMETKIQKRTKFSLNLVDVCLCYYSDNDDDDVHPYKT